jgi:2'-5' RNA ligase
MRLFAAVDPPADVLDRLAAALPLDPDAALRWVPREQWHVTLAFYGEVPSRTVAELQERLERAATRTPPFRLSVQGGGAFPRPHKARVLWLGLAGDVEVLSRLAERCAAAGRRCGIAMEDRAFRPHLTVARARREPLDLTDDVAAMSDLASPPWHVTTLRLVHSTLGKGAVHSTLGEWVL